MVSNIMRRAGLHVEEHRVQVRSLLGEVVEEEKVVGIREGRYKVLWSRDARGRIFVRVTLHAGDRDRAREAAERLEALGANVGVDEERVHAVFRVRGNGVKQVLDSIDIAEEATRRGSREG
jgi:hypothetical protein